MPGQSVSRDRYFCKFANPIHKVMGFLKYIILFFVAFATTGCGMEYHKDFEKAEALMQEHPKEALAVLDSIRQYPLKSKAANARFALLYSQALDKSYIDVTDDSLISIAENWYSQKDNVKEKFLSHYYKGVVNMNAKNYPEAIVAFSRAQKLEKQLDDYYLLGLLYNQMGYILNKHYEYLKSLDAFTKAYELYSLAEKTDHKNYMLMSIAGCYWNLGDYSNSEKYYSEAISEGRKTKYKVLVEHSVVDLIGQYIEQKRYTDALNVYNENNIPVTAAYPKFAGNIARLHYMTGKIQEGDEMLQRASKYAKNIDDTIALHINEYHIYKHLGKLELALEALSKCDDLKTKSLSLKMHQPVLEVQKQLLEKDLEYSNYKLEMDRKIAMLTALLLVILICITSYFLKLILKKKEKKLAYYIGLMDELQNTLQHLQKLLQLKEFQLDSACTDVADIINTRLNLINNLSTIFYEKHGTPKEKEIFIKEVEKIIKEFRTNAKDLEWMEKVINSSKNNLLEKIYSNYPTLTDDEKKLLCYIYTGFSSKAISVFLNIPIETVYNRKSRLFAKTGLSNSRN